MAALTSHQPSGVNNDSRELDARADQEELVYRLLVVDDDPDMRELVSVTLEVAGHDVSTASDGLDALEKLDTFDVDLVVLDVTMPRVNGYEVAQRLRARTERPCPVILMLSALSSPEDKQKGLLAGADDFTTKPFNLAHLTAHIDRMLS